MKKIAKIRSNNEQKGVVSEAFTVGNRVETKDGDEGKVVQVNIGGLIRYAYGAIRIKEVKIISVFIKSKGGDTKWVIKNK